MQKNSQDITQDAAHAAVRSRTKWLAVLALAALVSGSFAGRAHAGEYIEGDAIILLKPSEQAVTMSISSTGSSSGKNLTAAAVDFETFHTASVAAGAGAHVLNLYKDLSTGSAGKIFATVHSDTLSTEQLIANLRAHPDIAAVQPNYIQHIAKTPNDPGFNYYKINYSDGSVLYTNWGLLAINAPDAWDITTGSDQVYAAVIDSGIDRTNPDLKTIDAAQYSKNFCTKETVTSANYAYADGQGHGTHVAGIISAAGDNNIGIAGVNWNSKIITVRAMDNEGNGPVSNIMAGLDYILALLN